MSVHSLFCNLAVINALKRLAATVLESLPDTTAEDTFHIVEAFFGTDCLNTSTARHAPRCFFIYVAM